MKLNDFAKKLGQYFLKGFKNEKEYKSRIKKIVEEVQITGHSCIAKLHKKTKNSKAAHLQSNSFKLWIFLF